MLKTMEEREARQEEMRQRMQAPPQEVAFSEHFTVQELAATWKFSHRTVQRLAEKQPDVVRLGVAMPGKRSHFRLRIPAHVARRMYAMLTGQTEKPAEKKLPAAFQLGLVKRSRA
jgi:hypothetical protein